jgi:hypothetical protein
VQVHSQFLGAENVTHDPSEFPNLLGITGISKILIPFLLDPKLMDP